MKKMDFLTGKITNVNEMYHLLLVIGNCLRKVFMKNSLLGFLRSLCECNEIYG